MESKKINQLATNVNPQTSDLTTIGDPITGQLKKITWLQVAHLIGAQAAVTLQQVTDNGNTTTDPITTGGLTLTNLGTGLPRLTNGEFISTYGYGLANGVATLDSGGKIPASQLPSSVMEYKGTWNASTNTPTLADGTGDNGDVYLVNVAGSQNLGSGTISFAVGDWVVYNGTIWQKSLNSNAVASVFGRTGTIVAQEGDYNIDQLGDVAITTPATNDYLRYNGSSWVNTQFPTFVSSDKLVLQVRNNSGATINKGTVVYINGATAGYPTIAKAQANADNTSAQTLGLVQDNISNNSNGIVVLVGQITGIDTSAYPAGTQLYLSGTTAGAFTSTKTLAPTHLVYVGIVTAQNAVNGVIEVKIQNGYELEEIHDVSITSVANNQGLFYESSTDLWKNKSIATVLGYTPEQPLTFSAPLSRSTNTVSIPAATGSVNGYLTSTDWTTFNNKLSAAITSLNGLTAATQTFATGSSGTDFNISSTTSTHTFNIPSASAANRGLVTTGTQTFAGDKTFSGSLNGLTAVFTGSVTTPAGFYIDLNTYLYEGILQLTDLVNKKNILKFTASTSGHYINSLFLTGGSQQPIYISAKSTAGQNVIFNTDGTTTFGGAITGTTASFTSNSGNFNLGTQAGTAIYAHIGSKSASGGQAVAMRLAGTLTATANFDNLFGLWVDYTDDTAGYLGVTRYGIYQNDSAKRNYFGGPTTFNSAVTCSDTITATAFIPSGTSVPSRGMYTSASNVLDFSAGTTNLLSINYNTGLSTFNTGVRGNYFRIVNVSTAEFGINTENNQGYIGTTTSHGFNIMTNNTPRLTFHATTGAATFSSSAAKVMEIQSSTASGGYVRYTYNNTTSIGYIGSSSQLSGLGAVSDLELRADNNLILTTTSGQLRITSNGEVGIGVTPTTGNRFWVRGQDASSSNSTFYAQNGSGTPLLFVRNDGNIGVGETGPTHKLQIKGAADSGLRITDSSGNTRILLNPSGVQHGEITLLNNSGSGTTYLGGGGGNNYVMAQGGNFGVGTTSPDTYSYGGTRKFLTLRATLTNEEPFLQLIANGTGNSLIDFGNTTIRRATIIGLDGSSLAFYTNGTNSGTTVSPRMTITSGGDVLVGTTTTDVNTQGIQLRNNGIGIFVRSGASCLQLNRLTSDGIIASFRTSDVERGSISISGSTTTYNTSSDYRLKHDYKDFNGLDIVSKIKSYDFAWKENDSRMYGVIAHELQEILGYAVVGDKDGEQMQQVDYSKLTPILVKAIQEQQTQIEELKAKLN